jgi:maltooligosyltrehalose trehalohydrolase
MGADVRSPAGVHFKVWAPAASRVEVELTESGQYVPLTAQGDGVWSSLLMQVGPGTRYRYRLNGELSRPDPYSRSQPEGVHGPSAVVDPNAFEWHDDAWRGVSLQHNTVIYQCHVGAATLDGTFDSLIAELPRLQRLGVDAIEPLPVAEFPGGRN